MLLRAFEEGGWFMYVVLAAAVLATAVSVTALSLAMAQRTRQPALIVGVVAMMLGLLVPAIGGVGYALSMRAAFAAVANADPASRAPLLARAIEEAMNLIVLGAVCGVIPCVLALGAVIRAVLRPRAA